jgi:hypothetical protein
MSIIANHPILTSLGLYLFWTIAFLMFIRGCGPNTEEHSIDMRTNKGLSLDHNNKPLPTENYHGKRAA